MASRFGCKGCKYVAEYATDETPVCPKCRKRGLFMPMERLKSGIEELGNMGMCSHCGKFCSTGGVFVGGKFYGPTCAKRYGGSDD